MSANSEKQRRRGRGRPWQPGQSGNPSGRPRVEGEIRELARQYGAEAIAKLVHWMRCPDPKFSIAASGELLARGYGRPSQEVLVGPNGTPLRPPNFSISFADGGPGHHLPDDPVEASRVYHEFMRTGLRRRSTTHLQLRPRPQRCA